MVFDINTGESKRLEFDDVNSLTGCDKDSIIITTQTTGNIIMYDTNKMGIIKKSPLSIYPTDICYSPDDKSLYYVERNYIKKANIEDIFRDNIY